MDYSATLDGQMTMNDMERRCETEQLGGFKLDSIVYGTIFENGTPRLVNKAAFDMASSTAILDDLAFIVVGSDNPKAIIDSKTKSEGFTFICDSEIYIEGLLKRVLVFGKKS